ncbi:MAG: hypothetical protein WAO19_07430 [Candidatus Kryptoniota bacterium]
MEKYHGVVQNIVMVGEGEYRVVFRAYNGPDIEARLWENEDVPYDLYSMIARRNGGEYAFIAEGPLTDCVNVLRENSVLETVPKDDVDKWMVGELASDILSSLIDDGMFTQCTSDEEN